MQSFKTCSKDTQRQRLHSRSHMYTFPCSWRVAQAYSLSQKSIHFRRCSGEREHSALVYWHRFSMGTVRCTQGASWEHAKASNEIRVEAKEFATTASQPT